MIHCAVASGNLEMLKWLLTEKPIILEKKTMFNDPDTVKSITSVDIS